MYNTHMTSFRSSLIWATVALFYFYENILTTCLGVMTNEVMHHFNISHVEVGILASAFFTAYGIMQIPVGWFIQKYSVRNSITTAVILCVIGTWLFATSQCFYVAVLSRALMGIGASFAPLCAFEVAALYFHPRRFAMLTGLLLTFGSLGGISGQVPFKMLLEKFGFNDAIITLSVLGVVLALGLYIIVPNDKRSYSEDKKLSLKDTLTQTNVWLIMIYAALMYGPYLVLQSIWGKPFIEEALKISPHQAAGLLQIMMLGFLIGSPVLGYISDKYDQRKYFLAFSSLSTMIIMIALLQKTFMQLNIYALLLFLIGLCSSGFLISFTILKQSVPSHLRSISLGVMNSINTLGGITLPPLIGSWIQKNINSNNLYPYTDSLIILPILVFAALVCSLLINETKEKK